MIEPNNIINDYTQIPDTGTWGSYDETTGTWSNKVFSGKAIREWILHKLSAYGPYESVQAACTAIPVEMRKIGLTVGVIGANGQVREYLWKTSDLTDSGLVEKIEQVDLTIAQLGLSTITTQVGDSSTVVFNISGRSNISKGLLYQVVGLSEMLVSEITSLVKGENFVAIAPPNSSGTYIYRIRVVDSSGYYATTEGGDTYILYTIKYGGVTVNYNFTNFEKIAIKNITSVLNQYFTALIYVRDDSYEIEGVYLTDGEHDYKLNPYKTLNTVSDSYLGFNYYMLPDSQSLSQFDGNTCYIKVQYTEDGQLLSTERLLFTLLRADSLAFIEQSVNKNYYANFPDYYTLQLQSGISGISVYMQTDEDSDFIFDPVTISTYNNYSLRVIPQNIKENAHLKVKCTFTLNNIDYVHHFDKIIGNIIELPVGLYYVPNQHSGDSIAFDRIIEADVTDIRDADTASYYKVVDDFTSPEYTTCAFILDTYCKIDKTGINSTEYISIYQGNTKIGYVAEDVISCNGLITDTPLNDWVQIGFGFNLEEQVVRAGELKTVSYSAVYINGMVVKTGTTVTPLEYKADLPITIKIANGINVQKCFIYYKNNSQAAISPKADVYSIIYTNYLAHNPGYNEPSDLPVLKLLRITNEEDRHRYFRLLQQQNEDIKHLTTFGSIGLPKANDMSSYDGYYASSDIDSNATLFRLSVNIKKPALKAYANLCRGSYFVNGVNVLQDCIIEVHTQGTSTLAYALPNFKFTFWKIAEIDGVTTLVKFYPEFIQKQDGSYYQESTYTAKADFMDSSHLNNTPTCIFYNNTILRLIADDVYFPLFAGSPSAQEGNLDAIVGFPIVLEISDSASSLDDLFVNIGSFMLNIDKTGNSLGFIVNGDDCLSLEGTSNEETTGGAGRFVLPEETMKDYRNQDGTINTAEIDRDADVVQTAIVESGKKLYLESQLDGNAVKNHPYVKWCKFLSEGLEYRYPDSDIYKTGSDGNGTYISKILKVKDFKKIYKMWIWVATSDSNPNYKTEFTTHFDLYYCMLYFILLMAFAQTDNLGKNAMFDTWDGDIWYPRPYDLDSQAGLDNNAADNIAPFVEIMPEFSLDYNPDYTEQQKEEKHLLMTSKILYARLMLDRYHFSSAESKLWINFYKNYKSEIEGFYNLLRNYGGYTPENIIQLCKEIVIDKLGTKLYNLDFDNKYLGTVNQSFAYGNRWYKFKKWITQRFAFCDSYFGNADSALYNLSKNISYNITIDAPQYVKLTYLESSVVKFVTDTVNFSAGGGAATKISLSVNQDLVLDTDLFKQVYYDSLDTNYTNLINLDTSGNGEISTYTSLTGNTFNNLRNLKIDNSGVVSIDSLPNTIKTISAKNVTLQSVTIPQDCNIESVDFTGATINTDVNFVRLPKLKTLNFTNCTFNGNITLANLESLELFIITGAKFNRNIIIQDAVRITEFDFTDIVLNGIVFDGDNINISKLNFAYTKFGQTKINVNAIANNIRELIFSGCTGLTHVELGENKSFANLTTLGLYNSSITALGNNDTYFDASKINNISSLYGAIVSKDNSGVITMTKPAFTFRNTRIVDIRGLNWVGNCENLFYTCTLLESVQGTITAETSINNMFYGCSAINTIPTITIGDSVTTATGVFTNVNNIPYSAISAIIKKCKNVTNFSGFCRCTKIADNTTINLDDLFAQNHVVSDISWMFCPNAHGSGNLNTKTNKIKVSGKVPNSVTSAYATFYGLNTINVPYDIISTSTGLTDVRAMFASSNVTFYVPSGSSALLPSYVNEGLVVTLTNAIDKNFFCAENNLITTIFAMFLGSNVLTISNDVFDNLLNLLNCSCVFRGSLRSFSKELAIDNLWSKHANLTTVAGCFLNVKNVYCSAGLNFNQSVLSINITALFGISSPAEDSSIIHIDFNSIPSGQNWTVSGYLSYFGNATNGNGVFKNRKIHSTTNQQSILSNFRGRADYMFLGATLYLDENTTSVDLTNITDCDYMFNGCSTYKYKQSGSYTDADRIYVSAILPTSCKEYTSMFYDSNMLNNIPALRSSNAETLTNMFRACVFSPSLEVPADYLLVCKSNVVSTNYMFYDNNYITSIAYDSQVGLFSNCVNLTNVQYMFSRTLNLLGGIPNNLFGSTPLPKVRTLAHMFENTPVLYNVADGSNKWIDGSTVAPLTNLIDIIYLFNRTRQGNSRPGVSYRNQVLASDGTTLKYVIDPLTFMNTNLENISYAFAGSPLDIPFQFSSFQYANCTFFAASITEIGVPFVSSLNISNIRSITSMFERGGGSVTNLETFINALVRSSATMNNVAGGLTNEDIDETLRAHSTLDYSNYHGSFF